MRASFDVIWRIGFSTCLLALAVSCSNQLPATPADFATPIPLTSTPATIPLPSIVSPPPAPSNTPLPPTPMPTATAVNKAPALAATPLQTLAPRPAQRTITLADNGKTITMQIGERFLLDLGAQYDWQVTVNNQAVLSAVPNTARNGNQGLYETRQKGNAELMATGNPKCYNAVPRCLSPSLLFQLQIVVASSAASAELAITPANDGKTITLQTGQTFLLNLGDDVKWTVEIGDQSILSRVADAPGIQGAQGVYKAIKPGTTTLSATGPINCPPDRFCIMIMREFRVQVVVR